MRQTGKTKAMVEGLTDVGAVVIVHSGAMNDYVRRMIRDLRGRHVAMETDVRTVVTCADAERALMGLRRPVFVDHAFEELARPEVRALAHELLRGINLTRAAASMNAGRPMMMLEAGEPAAVLQARAEVSRLELRDGDLIVLRPAGQHTDEQVAEMLALLDWVTDDQRQKRIGLVILDPGAELTVLHHTPAEQEAPAEASAAPVERAA